MFVCLFTCSCNAYTFQMNICWMLLTLRSFYMRFNFSNKNSYKDLQTVFFRNFFFSLTFLFYSLLSCVCAFYLICSNCFSIRFFVSAENRSLFHSNWIETVQRNSALALYIMWISKTVSTDGKISREMCLFDFFRSFFFSCFMEISAKSRSKKHRLMQFVLVVADYLIELKWSLVYVVHTRLFVCVFVCRWITLHLKGTTTTATMQKTKYPYYDWLTYNCTSERKCSRRKDSLRPFRCNWLKRKLWHKSTKN